MMVRRPAQRRPVPDSKPADLAREIRAEIHRSATRRRPPITLPTVRGLPSIAGEDGAAER